MSQLDEVVGADNRAVVTGDSADGINSPVTGDSSLSPINRPQPQRSARLELGSIYKSKVTLNLFSIVCIVEQ